jgi:YD repeat-containing protein
MTTWDSAPPNGTVRGNQTSVSRYLNSSTYLKTIIKYNETGTVASIQMPSNAPYPDTTTSFEWSASYSGAVLTRQQDSLGHQTTYTYDAQTLQPTSTTDSNSQVTTYSYYADGRLKSVTLPQDMSGQQGETDYSYPSSNEVQTTVKQSSSQSVMRQQFYDGLGRPSRTILVGGCGSGNDVVSDTTYDAVDQVLTKTNPHCASGVKPTDGMTIHGQLGGGTSTPGYDAIGRPTLVTMQDGVSTQTWSYAGPTTTFTDEDGHIWTNTEDGLGRLIKVVEPGTLTTTYVYDAFGNLTSVNQSGASGDTPRQRGFDYDTLSRLMDATNVESGTVTYSYDAHGNLLNKTSPAVNATSGSQTVGYCYDALNRMIYKFYLGSYSCTSPSGYAASYTYDVSAVSGAQNTTGRLTDEKTFAGSTVVSERQLYSYDSMGRLLNENQFTLGSLTGSPAYAYDLGGNLVASTDGASPVTSTNTQFPCTLPASTQSRVASWTTLAFVNCFDSAGRTNSVTSNWSRYAINMFTAGSVAGGSADGYLYDPSNHQHVCRLGIPSPTCNHAMRRVRQEAKDEFQTNTR